MLIDILLLLLMAGSLGFIAYQAVRKFPQLSTINIKAVPDRQQAQIRRQILEEKLRRDIGTRWKVLYAALLKGRAEQISHFFSGVYQRLKDLEQEYRIARKKDLSSNVSKARSASELVREARELLADEEYARAEQLLIECLKIDEHNVVVYTLLAQVYRERGDIDHAQETLEFVLRLTEEKDPDVYGRLASLALERGDFARAQQEYQKSISLAPENYMYHLELAEVCMMKGDHDGARRAAEKALTLTPNNPKVLDFLIENSIILQDKNRAREYLAKLVDVNPQNGKIQSFRERIET